MSTLTPGVPTKEEMEKYFDDSIYVENLSHHFKMVVFNRIWEAAMEAHALQSQGMVWEQWRKEITDRITHFQKTFHAYEAGQLTLALKSIDELIPPFESPSPSAGVEPVDKYKAAEAYIREYHHHRKDEPLMKGDEIEMYHFVAGWNAKSQSTGGEAVEDECIAFANFIVNSSEGNSWLQNEEFTTLELYYIFKNKTPPNIKEDKI